jgi:hypothetical protein
VCQGQKKHQWPKIKGKKNIDGQRSKVKYHVVKGQPDVLDIQLSSNQVFSGWEFSQSSFFWLGIQSIRFFWLGVQSIIDCLMSLQWKSIAQGRREREVGWERAPSPTFGNSTTTFCDFGENFG